MNNYLIKEYLKKIMTDDVNISVLKLYFLMLFWVTIPFVVIFIVLSVVTLIVVQFEFLNNLLISLPWGKLPVSDEGRTLIQVLTFAVISLFILSIEIQVIQKVAGVINEKFKKIAAGGHDEN